MFARKLVCCCLLLLAVSFIVGCNNEPPTPPLFPVKGKVTVDGAPVTSGQVSFFPVDKALPTGSAQIQTTGDYEIMTGGKSGAAAGKFKVMVNPSMVPEGGKMPKAPFNEKFKDSEKSGIVFDVSATPPASGYDIKLTK